MNTRELHLSKLSEPATESIELPMELVERIKAEARAQRKPIATVLRHWLEDQADAREAARRWKDLQSGKTKPVPAETVFKRLGVG